MMKRLDFNLRLVNEACIGGGGHGGVHVWVCPVSHVPRSKQSSYVCIPYPLNKLANIPINNFS